MFFDSTFLLLVPAMLISIYAQSKISSTFNKYSKVKSYNGYTGAQVARIILDDSGLHNVPIELVSGKLSDHYDPRQKVLRLSQDVYYNSSVASIGVAAHEVGHAIQHKNSYAPLIIRNAIVPAVNIGSNFSWILFVLGLMLGIRPLITFGILLFSAVVVFQLITLPVEFNASSRALKILKSKNILYPDEVKGAQKVLGAAAMTYVAATLMAISQLLRLIVISDRDR
ncbi:neutral zinc metallopeptidase [Clostridium folliculivorans]|uniref:Neutral zinc metallopeptidase n=2 Tax=Clostridium folliculivorans TaxID=2886038 RepID=A0A9W5Y1J6_9CLOT|nr:neutral zinc metallopeptidase [Clostridium folliculivorans]GKU30905.1 neutral zinc metallopeptidase [Clostridium folliculivorans]